VVVVVVVVGCRRQKDEHQSKTRAESRWYANQETRKVQSCLVLEDMKSKWRPTRKNHRLKVAGGLPWCNKTHGVDEYEDGRKTGEVAQAYYGFEGIHKTYLAILWRYFGSRREKEYILEREDPVHSNSAHAAHAYPQRS
jgi:hypothetical protein